MGGPRWEGARGEKPEGRGLQSKAMHRNFLALTHVDQNLFLHDTVKLSYELLDSNDYELAQMDDENHIKAAPVLIS